MAAEEKKGGVVQRVTLRKGENLNRKSSKKKVLLTVRHSVLH